MGPALIDEEIPYAREGKSTPEKLAHAIVELSDRHLVARRASYAWAAAPATAESIAEP